MSLRPRPTEASAAVAAAFSDAPWRKKATAPVDCADYDPATRMGRARTPKGAFEVDDTEGWFSKQKKMQVLPRVQGHPFDPYTQAREDLYIFNYDIGGPRLFFDQTRTDGARLGQLEATAVGGPRASIVEIQWHKHSGGVYEISFVGERGMVVAEGYCKMTDVGGPAPGALGKLKWVVVVTRLWGRDLPATQTDQLFSPPLYEALATGVAFGLYPSDNAIKLAYPLLGAGRAAIGASLEAPVVASTGVGLDDSIHGKGADQWVVTDAVDRNTYVKADSKFRRFTPAGSKLPGSGMEVTNVSGLSVGAMFPLRKENVVAATDAVEVHRMEVVETPVKFHSDETLKGVSRYSVSVYARGKSKPMATLDVAPVALPSVGGNGKLAFKHHVTKPLLGSTWTVGAETIIISTTDQKKSIETTPVYDPRLHATIEATMHALRTQHESATVFVQ